MNHKITGILVVLAFFAGCAAYMVIPEIVVPPATAQTVMRWDYACQKVNGSSMESISGDLKQFGAQGWELAHLESIHGFTYACFKRPM